MNAYKIRDLDTFTGDAALYRVEPPMRGRYSGVGPFSFVVVSAADVPFSGPETYIFGATDGADADERLHPIAHLARRLCDLPRCVRARD